MRITYLALLGALLVSPQVLQAQEIILPASSFLEEIPKGNQITSPYGPRSTWTFNNTGLILNSKTNLMLHMEVPVDGNYNLFVRSSRSKEAGSFKVAINDQVTDSKFGETETWQWKKGGVFTLKAGRNDVKITRIEPGSVFDVLVLTMAEELDEEEIKKQQLHPDVKLLQAYEIPYSNAVKFGDVTGDGKTDFLVFERNYTTRMFDHNGRELWSWKAPERYSEERSEFEAPGVIWDFDGDGKSEVVHWRMTPDDKEWLVMADGETGEIKNKVLWPTAALPHKYNNFRLAIAKLTPGVPNEIAVFSDYGGTITICAYDASLKQLWKHTETRKKDNLGHYIYPVDLNDDGIDEVLVGSLLLDAAGQKVWDRFDLMPDNHDHADSYRFADINGDGKTDIATANSETGVFVFEGMTGEIIWQNVAEHTQQVQVGDFLNGEPAPQVVTGARTYGNRSIGEPYLSSQLYWFSNSGELLKKWPGQPINGNPDFVLGDWKGDGDQELFWYKFRVNDEGKGELYFPDGVFHMFDFSGDGSEEVITIEGGFLRIYGSKSAQDGVDKKADKNYLKSNVANHTHY